MERDFMGLNSKESVVVKEEFVEGGREDSGFSKSSGAPLLLSDKVSAFPQFIRQSGNIQSFGGGTMKQQLPPGNHAPVVGTTELWIDSKPFSVSPQLTIFFDGSVHVFDGIPPEKAEAIMLLAATGSLSHSLAQPKLHLQASAPKHPTTDQPLLTLNMSPHSGLPSPMSVSSNAIDHSGVLAATYNDIKVSSTASIPTTLATKLEQPKVMPSVGSMATSAIMSSAVPQARKASLARFLEKRKERVMSSSPYNLSKKAADCTTGESNGIGFSATSGASSTSMSVSGGA